MEIVIQNSQTGNVWIKESVSKGVIRANICSAYIQSEAFRFFFEEIFESNIKIRVLARWALSDLLSKASDLATYELCRSKNIDFYIKQDFHGKLYGLAPFGVLIGSFNLTNRGFSISQTGNDEAGVLIKSNSESNEYFENLFLNARQVDDGLYEKISNFVLENLEIKSSNTSWPDDILELMKPKAIKFSGKMLVDECLSSTFSEFMNSSSDARAHDMSLLSIDDNYSKDLTVIRAHFRRSKIFKWFCLMLREQEGNTYFGKATALLHDHLFDDPKPYRQKVKSLLINLLSWIDGLNLDEITIDRPNHSQRITLNY